MWGKTKVMRISRKPSPVQIIIGKKKQVENVEFSTIWVACQKMMQDVHVKLNPGLPLPEQHLRRKRFSPVNWT
jgi:hypothetical protein